jgi:ribosomal protein S18 acetylase RimI-like enzyme
MSARAAEASRYRIRPAIGDDHDAVARELRAYLTWLGEELDGEGLDKDIAHWQSAYDGARGRLLVVEDPEGVVVGTAAVRLLEPGVGEIKRMWIRPAHQGKGLGRPLMDACLTEARALGCRRVRLDSERRLAAAVHLYRAYGFKEIPDYNGNTRAEVWMEREL